MLEPSDNIFIEKDFMIDNQNNLDDTKLPTKPPTRVSFPTIEDLWQDRLVVAPTLVKEKKGTLNLDG
jgi:hypothetical protein